MCFNPQNHVIYKTGEASGSAIKRGTDTANVKINGVPIFPQVLAFKGI